MSQKDKIKWDNKYQKNSELLDKRAPSKILEAHISDIPLHRALDLACGAGRNSIFLAQNGFVVDSVDISKMAIDMLKKRAKNFNITPLVSDLDNFTPIRKYDLILMINYLDRELIDRAKGWLNQGAVMIVETYMQDEVNEKQDSNPNYLLKSGELKEIFKAFDILEYREFFNEPYEQYRMKKSSIVAKNRS